MNDPTFEKHVRDRLDMIILLIEDVQSELVDNTKIVKILDNSMGSFSITMKESGNTFKHGIDKLGEIISCDLKNAMQATNKAFEASSGKFDKSTVLILLCCFMGLSAMFMGYSMQNGFVNLNKGIQTVAEKQVETTETIIDNRLKAEERAAKSAQTLLHLKDRENEKENKHK